MRVQLLLLAFILMPLSNAADQQSQQKEAKEKTWYEKRDKRPDIYYPHKLHLKVMEKEGDSCLLCHPFNKNNITDIKQLKLLNVIANEPLEAICHECHVVQLTAPWRCDLCHNDATKIWPADHNLDYANHHGEAARLDSSRPKQKQCGSCHIDLSFCSDCHFRRDKTQRRVHGLGYRASHGIEARMSAASCSRCHNVRYCSDCHQERR